MRAGCILCEGNCWYDRVHGGWTRAKIEGRDVPTLVGGGRPQPPLSHF